MPTIQVQDHTIYYETLGEGTPLLLMHGWTQTGDDMHGLAEHLPGYQIYIPDLPGYGRSVPPTRTYPVDFYHRDTLIMAGFLGALGLSDMHIMGFSDGGEVALMLGVLRPDLCRTVVAWGAIGLFTADACEQARRGLPPTWITDELRAQHPGQDVDQWPYQWVEAFCRMIEAGGDLTFSRAQEIACPLLLMLGENDYLNPIETGRKYVERAKKGNFPRVFKVFPNIGHAIHEQAPEAFPNITLDFLRRAENWYRHGDF